MYVAPGIIFPSSCHPRRTLCTTETASKDTGKANTQQPSIERYFLIRQEMSCAIRHFYVFCRKPAMDFQSMYTWRFRTPQSTNSPFSSELGHDRRSSGASTIRLTDTITNKKTLSRCRIERSTGLTAQSIKILRHNSTMIVAQVNGPHRRCSEGASVGIKCACACRGSPLVWGSL